MPIKFRCQHCRQFLGISRDRAGDVFDCPTCGRSIRVPELDGTVRPLPRPSLDLGDSQLRQALDELADLGRSGGSAIEFDAIDKDQEGPSVSRNSGSPEIPPREAVRAEVISVAPQPAPKPIDLAPVQQNLQGQFKSEVRATQRNDQVWKAVVELAEGDSSDLPVIEPEVVVPTAKVSDAPARAVATETPATQPQLTEWNSSFWFAAVGIAAAVFTAGFWVGRLTVVIPVAESSRVPATSPEPNQVIVPPTATSNDAAAPALRGRITFRMEGGAQKPDQGARVIALPVDWAGKTKLQVVGFRATDSFDDQRVARASLQAMGGDLAITNEAGEYSLALKSGGQFVLVVLSGSMPRPDSEDVQNPTSQLATYFDRPTQLIGKVMVHLERISSPGEGTQLWDHVFQRS